MKRFLNRLHIHLENFIQRLEDRFRPACEVCGDRRYPCNLMYNRKNKVWCCALCFVERDSNGTN